jgi:hypothetical protein
MPQVRKSSKKNKASINLSILLIIIVLLAILSYALSFLFINDASDEQEIMVTKPNHLSESEVPKGDVKIITPINGVWYSTYDGAILSIDGTAFKLELPSVQESKVIKGTLSLAGKEVVFTYTENSQTCKGIPGRYHWETKGQNKIIFEIISDKCTSRTERMSALWERF